MMSSAMMAVAQGISQMATTNDNCQFNNGLSVLDLVMIYLPLQQKWSKILSNDAEQIFIANMEVPGNPAGSANVAAKTEIRNTDSTKSDAEIGELNNVIQGAKAMAQLLGNAMSNTYDMQEPLNDLLKTLTIAAQQMR